MKVLITGALGQLGRALVETAPADVTLAPVDLEDFDIGDETAVSEAVAAIAPDLIVNCAAYTAVDKAESDQELAFRINSDAVRWLAQAAERSHARLVQISTDFVFDGRGCRPYRTSDPTGPTSVYGASKLAGEAEALQARDALVLRTAWLYSKGGTNFAKTMLRFFNERPAMRVVADQIGTPTSAKSLAQAVWGLTAAGVSGVQHFTDAGAASWYDFAVAVCEEGAALRLCPMVAIEPIRTEDYPTPATRPAYSVLDKTDAWAALGAPARHWREELRVTLKDIKDHG